MEFIKGKYSLIIPKHAENADTINLHSSDVLKKLSHPYRPEKTDPMQIIKEIYDILHSRNLASMKYKDRYKLLQSVRDDTLSNTMKLSTMLGESNSLDNRSKNIIDTIFAVEFEMLLGYKTVVENGLNTFFYSRKIILSSLHHAMYLSSRILYFSYTRHLKVPKGVWYDLHSLYQVSIQLGVSGKKLRNIFANQQLNTLSNMYKNYILLAIIEPQRFKKQSITQFLFLTEQWVSLLTLTNKFNKDKTLYFIDPANDAEPKLISEENTYGTNVLFLDLSRINKRLENLIRFHQGEVKHHDIFNDIELSTPLYYIEMILKRWSAGYFRIKHREKSSRSTRVCVGLSSLYDHVSHFFTEKEQVDVLIDTSNEFSDVQEINLDKTPLPENSSIAKTNEEIDKPKLKPIYTTQIIDLTEEGCCLMWTAPLPSNLKSGEIIAVEMEDKLQQSYICIGVVRWIVNDENAVQTGIEFISNEALPVLAKVSSKENAQFVPSLLIIEKNDAQDTYWLIINAIPFLAGNRVEIVYGIDSIKVDLVKEEYISLLYKKFSINITSSLSEMQHIANAKANLYFTK